MHTQRPQIRKSKEVTKGKFIDLFAGCGGLSLGLSRAGWKGVLAVEKDPMAFETLKLNLVDGVEAGRFAWPVGIPKEPLPIQSLLSDYEKQVKLLKGSIDLIAGGPPCQGFSFAGKRNGADPRNQMLLHYVGIVSQIRPKFILIENVKGITAKHSASEEAYADVLKRKLGELNYSCVAKIIKASDCFVPQERPRFILLGVDKEAFPNVDIEALLATEWDTMIEKGKKAFLINTGLEDKKVSCQDALSDLETKGAALIDCPDANKRLQVVYRRPTTKYQKLMHGEVSAPFMDSMRLAKHAASTIARFKWIQENCRHGINLSHLELSEFANRKQVQVVLDANKPSLTLTTLPDDLIHYSEPRILTVREYARLQSFPDWFKFHGKYTTGGLKSNPRMPKVHADWECRGTIRCRSFGIRA